MTDGRSLLQVIPLRVLVRKRNTKSERERKKGQRDRQSHRARVLKVSFMWESKRPWVNSTGKEIHGSSSRSSFQIYRCKMFLFLFSFLFFSSSTFLQLLLDSVKRKYISPFPFSPPVSFYRLVINRERPMPRPRSRLERDKIDFFALLMRR